MSHSDRPMPVDLAASRVVGMPMLQEAIRASAGSGKTYALSLRYLKRLADGIPPQTVLATTFTRKAAGEILARILSRLARAALDPMAARVLAEELSLSLASEQAATLRFQSMLVLFIRALHQVAISTLDSWFQRLAQGFRLELALSGELQVVDTYSPRSVQLRLEAVRQVLSGGPEVVALLDVLLDHQPRRSVQGKLDATVRALHQVYEQTTLSAWQTLDVPNPPATTAVQDAMAVLRASLSSVDKTWQKALNGLITAIELRRWSTFLSATLVQKVIVGETTYSRKPIPEPLYDALKVLAHAAAATILSTLAEQTRATGALLERYDQVLTRLKQKEQLLYFSDLPRLLAGFVPQVHAQRLAERLDGGIDHLMLDEFQDTSPEQWTILLPLARRVAQAHGSLFVVGDVKQAIYGWRGGVAEIFDQLSEDLPGLRWSALAKSFRSSRVVLDVVNRVFSHIASAASFEPHHIPVAQAWQARFIPHEAAKDLPGFVSLEVAPALGSAEEVEAEEADDASEEESGLGQHISPLSEYAAERIVQLAREAPESSLGVLVRTNKMVKELLFLLTRHGLQASGEGGSAIDDDPAVEAILAAFTLADHPGDTVAAWHLRTSPLGQIVGMRRKSDDTRPPRSAGAVAEELRRELIRQGYASLIANWMAGLAPHCKPRSMVRLQQLLELAWTWDPDRGLRPQAFVEYVRSTPVEEPSPARVRVMTVHKAKGLEFDQVVLLELHKGLLGMRPEVLVDRPEPAGPIQAVFRNAPKDVRALHPSLERAHAQYEAREITEGLCELYVAMTRARHALYMLVPARKGLKDGGLSKVRFSHASILRDLLTDPRVVETELGRVTLFQSGQRSWRQTPAHAPVIPPGGGQGGRSTAQQQDVPSPLSEGVPLAKTPAGSARGLHMIHPSGLQQEARVTVEELLRPDEDPALLRGQLLHALASRIELLPPGFAGTLAAMPAFSQEAILRLGQRTSPGSSSDWALGAIQQLERALSFPSIRRVFAGPPLEKDQRLDIWRERPFLVQVDRALLKGTFDRVELLWQGNQLQKVTLFEFKSDGLTRQNRGVLERRYQGQLDAYRDALRRMLGLEDSRLDAHLVWLSSPSDDLGISG